MATQTQTTESPKTVPRNTKAQASEHEASRQRAMSAFAQAKRQELADGLAGQAADPAWSFLRKPETGLIMARGRMGGSDAPFNFGEVTVTRCSVILESGENGHATIMGRDKEKARLAALADAHWQNETGKTEMECRIVAPVLKRLAEEDDTVRCETEATKVDFFTMSRGED